MNISPELIAQISAGPLGMLIVGLWVKTSIKRVESIPDVLNRLKNIEQALTEIKIEIKSLHEKKDDIKEKVILLKANMDAAWKHIDEIKSSGNL